MGIVIVGILIVIVGLAIYLLTQTVCSQVDKAKREAFYEANLSNGNGNGGYGLTPVARNVDPNPLRGFLKTTTLQQISAPLRNKKVTFKNPNFYEYKLDGNSQYISHGGNDMYDAGNYTMVYVDGYTSPVISYNTAVSQFIQHNGKKVEHIGLDLTTPLMYLCKSADRATVGFRKTGNLGADNSGQQRTDVIYNGEKVSGLRIFAWRRLVFNAWDPSICDLYFAIADDTSTIHNTTMYTNNDSYTDGGFSQFYMDVSNTLMGCMLLSKPSGIAISVDECKESLSKLCKFLSDTFVKQFVATDPGDSFKCKDCLLAFTLDRGIPLQRAGEMVEGIMKVSPDEYLAMMGQSLDNIPKEMQAQLPAMDLNEIIGQMQKMVLIDAEGDYSAVDACVVPLSLIARMIKDSPSKVSLKNTSDMMVKVLKMGPYEMPTNIKSSYTNNVEELMKLDPANDQMKTYGALVSVSDQSEIRSILIELFSNSDSETMRKINGLFTQYKITFDQRQEAKRVETASAKVLADARVENSQDSSIRDSTVQAEGQQRGRTETAQQRANQAATRLNNVLSNIQNKLNNSWYFPPGV